MAFLSDGGFTGFLYSLKETGRKFTNGAKELVEDFVSGFNGHGWKLWKNKGSWRLELDELLVRKTFTVFEQIISKITSIRGSYAITQGHAKIKSVGIDNDDVYRMSNDAEVMTTELCYILEIEDEVNSIERYDLIRCQKNNKFYHAQVGSVFQYIISIPTSEFETDEDGNVLNPPEAGDEIVQFGNASTLEAYKSRHSAIYLSLDNEEPCIDLMTDLYSKDWSNAIKTRIGGNLPGTDGDRGFYCVNGMIKSVNDKGITMYEIRPDGTGFFSAGNIEWTKDGLPKLFFGTSNPSTGTKTGIIQGVDCIVAGEKRTGIYAVVDDEILFEIDTINKQSKFTGKIETGSEGQRIVISPETKDIKIFDKNNKNVITLEGNEYNDIDELYSDSMPTADIINIPLTYPKNVITKYSKDVTSVIYNSGYTIAKMTVYGLFQAGFRKPHSVTVRVKVYSDEHLQNLELDALLALHSNDRSFDDFSFDVNYPMAKGYNVIYITLQTTQNYISDGEIFQISDVDISFVINEYISKLFANGIVFGTSSENMFTFLNKKKSNGENGMIGLISNGLAGIELKWDKMLVQKDGRKGMISPTLCCGWVTIDPDRATFQQARTWDNTSLSIRKTDIGTVIITFDDSWRGIIGYGNAYAMLTGMGNSIEGDGTSPIKATFIAWSGNGFMVSLSDDASKNDGAFFFEVKLY